MTETAHVEPVIVGRTAQPYAGMRRTVTMDGISEIADRIPDVVGWLLDRGIRPAGAPFLKYNVVDMARQLEVEAGVPVDAEVRGDAEVFAGVLPAGRYATRTHLGHPDQLVAVTGALLAWGAEQGLTWDVDGDRWGARLEIYHTNPAEQPDPNKWETELAFRLAG